MTQTTRNEATHTGVIYLNQRFRMHRETIDELRQCDFADDKAWRKEARRLQAEYTLAGQPCYLSSRKCSGW